MTAPYYADADVTLWHGDALELIADQRLGLFDAVITDPPYCSGAHESARRGKRSNTTPESVAARPTIAMDDMGTLGYEWTSRRWFMGARRLTKPGGHIAVFTDWRMSPQVQLMLEVAGWRLTNMVVWDKGYPGLGSGFRAQHELIIVASNGEPQWHSYEYGNVLQDMRLTRTDHPHEKPDGLLVRMITTCTPPGGMVLDPFAGAGTTLVAAKSIGRKAVGIEINEAYCTVASKRLAQEALPFSVVATTAREEQAVLDLAELLDGAET